MVVTDDATMTEGEVTTVDLPQVKDPTIHAGAWNTFFPRP